MPANPFQPPETDPARNPPPPPGSPLKAVLAGLAVDVGGSALLSLVITVLYALQLHGEGLSDDEMRDAMARLPHDSVLFIAGTLLGALLSVAGGYVCARIARRDEYRIGLVMAAVSGLAGLLLGGVDEAADMALLLTFTGIACNLLGVKYGADHNRRAQAPSAPTKDASTP
jgi:MFS family permease